MTKERPRHTFIDRLDVGNEFLASGQDLEDVCRHL